MLVKTLKHYKSYIILLFLKLHLYMIGLFIFKTNMLKHN